MSITQLVHCPNCGSFAEKNYLENHIMRTSCNSCDYLLVQCSRTYKVIESYAPGINYIMSTASESVEQKPTVSRSEVERPLVAHKQR